MLVILGNPPNKKLYAQHPVDNAGSEWQDDIDGLADYYNTFFREYDPVIGRFNGVDPLAEMANEISTYAYAEDNPIMFNDPLGDKPPKGHHWGGYGWLPNIGNFADFGGGSNNYLQAAYNLWHTANYGGNGRGWDELNSTGGESGGGGGSVGGPRGGGGRLYTSRDAAAIGWAKNGGALNTKTNFVEYASVIFSIEKNGVLYYGYTPHESFEGIEGKDPTISSPGPGDNLNLRHLPNLAIVVAFIHSHPNKGLNPNVFSPTTFAQRGDEWLMKKFPDLKFYLVTPNGHLFNDAQGPNYPMVTGFPDKPVINWDRLWTKDVKQVGMWWPGKLGVSIWSKVN